jgi:hypothetical protein
MAAVMKDTHHNASVRLDENPLIVRSAASLPLVQPAGRSAADDRYGREAEGA